MRQMVGPFIIFGQMGPAGFLTDQGIDVCPHPHTGLATAPIPMTGAIQHRDSLGINSAIPSGEINGMITGKDITHAERTPPRSVPDRHRP